MKKLFVILFAFLTFNASAQTIRSLIGLEPTVGRPGYIYRDTSISVPYSIKNYLTGYKTFAQLSADSITTGILAVANGGTGTATPGLVAGTNITLSGTWPNQTINSSGGGGSGWLTTGNTVSDTTSRLGTTTSYPLVFEINGIRSGQITYDTTGNTSFGYRALQNSWLKSATLLVGNGSENTAFGNKPLATLSNGFYNVGLGSSVLYTLTTGSNNVGVGTQAMSNVGVAVTSNIAIGTQALQNATGSTNIGIGKAIMKGVSGTGNTGVGDNALFSLVAGTYNTAIGTNTLSGVTGGSNNTAVGMQALNGTTGGDNTAVGYQVLFNNGASGSSSGFGEKALFNSTGANNAGFGYYAGAFLTSETKYLVLNSITRTDKNGDLQGSPFISQQNTTVTSQKNTLNGKTGFNTVDPTAWVQFPANSTVAGTAPIKLTYTSIATTATTGNTVTATITFAAKTSAPFVVGSTIVVAGVTPSGYNGTFVVTACTTTTVSFANATTAAQTVAGTIIQGQLMTTPEAGAIEYDGTHFYGTDNAGVRHQLDN